MHVLCVSNLGRSIQGKPNRYLEPPSHARLSAPPGHPLPASPCRAVLKYKSPGTRSGVFSVVDLGPPRVRLNRSRSSAGHSRACATVSKKVLSVCEIRHRLSRGGCSKSRARVHLIGSRSPCDKISREQLRLDNHNSR